MTDDPGTCHRVGCPGKGVHPPHNIGAGEWSDYQHSRFCIGFPMVQVVADDLMAYCSLKGAWVVYPDQPLSPKDMAELVDQHKAECPNREVTT